MQNLSLVKSFRRAVDPAPELSGFDPDTGLAQRTLFRSRFDRQWDQCAEGKQPLAALLIGLDGVDREAAMTHQAALTGCIREVGRVVTRCCRRRADFAGRMRTQEIGVMLAESTLEGVREVAERMVADVTALQLPHPLLRDRPLTISAGGAITVPNPTRFASSLLIFADRALTAACLAGGKRVMFYDEN